MTVRRAWRFPRLYVAASLKHLVDDAGRGEVHGFSAALCRGLIEARRSPRGRGGVTRGFSAALCRGLIEAAIERERDMTMHYVFRGFMSRPH